MLAMGEREDIMNYKEKYNLWIKSEIIDLDTKKELVNFEIVDFFKTSNLNNSETYITIWKKKN